jgi:hypothetical protein
MKESLASSQQNENEQKRPWQAPTIEELDFGATEAAYIPGLPVDLGIYTV